LICIPLVSSGVLATVLIVYNFFFISTASLVLYVCISLSIYWKRFMCLLANLMHFDGLQVLFSLCILMDCIMSVPYDIWLYMQYMPNIVEQSCTGLSRGFVCAKRQQSSIQSTCYCIHTLKEPTEVMMLHMFDLYRCYAIRNCQTID